ncbi:putative lycopene epsilon-cyclase [Lupinus albus]|uniref:Putative lycopene epsilon-cyclase n=1 Tax=Lupinus albus TaxID=3870 RepID=A0A6A4QF91_LUPAL|nr:putative lycopene epsilon-cyclase [Lupinus albus]
MPTSGALDRVAQKLKLPFIVYLDNKDHVLVGRSHDRVSHHLLHEELLRSWRNVLHFLGQN